MALADPVDLVREACTLLAGYLPQLARLTPEPDIAECAAPGMSARPSAAPVPGNVPAFYAKTSIDATARQLEGVLKYATGARRGGLLAVRGGSDANTLQALDAISGLIAIADDDFYRLILSELDARLDEARCVRAIDEAQQWRYVPHHRCRYCECASLKVALDERGAATAHVECFGHDAAGRPCRTTAAMTTDSHGRAGLAWPDGFFEPGPDG